ncbi:ROK family protein [Clostridium polynesiense]|uniref:ROK family protein n=1 Tax=Clostridium polynesiense TaxID=1325933 RepID=UPI00058B7F28|nr:ROK family protein [Clostridium polynesiense]
MNIACFDIGGTFIKYSVINEKGEILLKDKFSTPKENCRIEIPKALVERIKDISNYFKIDAAGISTAGQVDSDKGEIVFATENLPGYTGAKISEHLRNELNLPSYVENDVNAAAVGEMWMGAAKGKNNFACITLGTGIGGAIVIDGKLYKGINGGAGEFGHMSINEHGENCTCGFQGCFERYSSTSALIRRYKAEAEKAGSADENATGESIMKLVREGNNTAVKVYKDFLAHLATGIANVVHILDPGLIVIGGGISAQGQSFINELEEVFKTKAMKAYADNTEIVTAQLQNDAGVYGACYLALKNMIE